MTASCCDHVHAGKSSRDLADALQSGAGKTEGSHLLVAHVSSCLGLLPVLRPLALVHIGPGSHLSPLTSTALSRGILGLGSLLVLRHTCPASTSSMTSMQDNSTLPDIYASLAAPDN